MATRILAVSEPPIIVPFRVSLLTSGRSFGHHRSHNDMLSCQAEHADARKATARLVVLPIVALVFAHSPAASAQETRPTPDVVDASYGPHERQVLDLWMADSGAPSPLVVYFHEGGFRQGSKEWLPTAWLEAFLAAGFSVASVNYRLTSDAPFPTAMSDGARAVQFLRTRAHAWNLDPARIGATGGSAGAGIAMWIAFHDDLADRGNPDPVLAQSTRLAVVAVVNGQTSYDPRWIAEHIGERAAEHPFFDAFDALRAENVDSAYRLVERASPLNHLTAGDPPAFLFYNQEPRERPPPDAVPGTGMHHIVFGEMLKRRMEVLGIECVVIHRDEYADRASGRSTQDMVAFLIRHLSVTTPAKRPGIQPADHP